MTNTRDALNTFWIEHLERADPLAYALRERFADRWVRFHSLPESKRYPDTKAETAEILKRHNTLMGDLFAPGTDVYLLTTHYTEHETPGTSYDALTVIDTGAQHWTTILGEDEDDINAHIYVSEWTWAPGVFDPVLRLVINDQVSNIMIADAESASLLHPYDGGMDVIVKSSDDRNRLKARYIDWLPQNSQGL